MNPIWGHLVGVITVLLMLTFIGIWIWAWNARHKHAFDRLARLPLEGSADGNDEKDDRP
ncbi:MAG: cbb3-type cytochrome c oxidase subunit 3 [Mizugakiibacter sp.]|uniref:cbb3-type cytochrome oxidase subunit 3 n=1 Tax=Mizugakiibacter sp. TaxID=1972610 RepID=UPI0031BD075E|nr:cbb3-type cytochrome c oxidase subunit 3 [Xanthomonadaceae bacterium]